MISLGAAIFFIGFPALLLGMIIGDATHRRHADGENQAPAATEWGAISRAAADSYRGASADAYRRLRADEGVRQAIASALGAAQPDWMPRMILTSNAVPVGGMELVDANGFRALTGVDPETILQALGHRPTIRWGDTIPEGGFTLA